MRRETCSMFDIALVLLKLILNATFLPQQSELQNFVHTRETHNFHNQAP